MDPNEVGEHYSGFRLLLDAQGGHVQARLTLLVPRADVSQINTMTKRFALIDALALG